MRARLPTLVATLCCLATAADAQVLRNPQGTTPASGTTRDAAHPGAGGPTRPPLGSQPSRGSAAVGSATTAPGHALGVGPNGAGNNGTGLGSGGPGVTNPGGANGSAFPSPLGGSRPNGGSPTNGAKPSPMQANGVRKVE